MKRAWMLSLLVVAGCVGHVFAAPLLAYAAAEDALCKSHLSKSEVDPSDGGYLYICRRNHGTAHYELIALPAPGGTLSIPGDETIENATCGLKPNTFSAGCTYECDWPEGWSSTTPSAVSCDGGELEAGGTSQLTTEPRAQ